MDRKPGLGTQPEILVTPSVILAQRAQPVDFLATWRVRTPAGGFLLISRHAASHLKPPTVDFQLPGFMFQGNLAIDLPTVVNVDPEINPRALRRCEFVLRDPHPHALNRSAPTNGLPRSRIETVINPRLTACGTNMYGVRMDPVELDTPLSGADPKPGSFT